jgi:DNA repair protein RecO (recombination protein O)
LTQTEIVKGIVLSSFDYKEKDKLVEVFTVEHGKITAVLKGCKSPNAKLKFAFQPFCFAEFSIVRLGKFYQIIDAKLIDSFFDLTKDLNTYYLSSLALELASVSIEFEEQNPTLFILLLNILKYICYDKLPADLILAKFAEDIMNMLGYKINFCQCSNCGMQYLGKVYLNLDSGAFVCSSCKNDNCLLVSNQAFSLLKILSNTEYNRLATVKIASNASREAILAVCKNLEHRLVKIIHSAKFI